MFVAINLDLASVDSANNIKKIINEYGIKKVHSNLYESFEFPANRLGNLKREVTNCIDDYDKLRIYQYPLEDSFKISYIENKKWKKLSIR